MEEMAGELFAGRNHGRTAVLLRSRSGVLLWLGWCLLLVPCMAAQHPEELFLNNIAHCKLSDDKSMYYKVDQKSLYSIKDDIRPEFRTGTMLSSCEIRFRSTRVDGRVCVFQRSLQFKSSYVELKLYDGIPNVDGKTTVDHQVNEDNELLNVEWCTKSRHLTLEMRPRAQKASVKDAVIDLLVYDMASVHRKAYLDTSPSCGSEIEMDHSRVNVTSLDLTSATSASDVHWMCSLDFSYTGQKKNRSLCMVFEARDQPGARCVFNYTLQVYVSVPVGDGSWRKELSHEGGCDKPLPQQWCSNGTKISLTLKRNAKGEVEKDILFNALIVDHGGDARTLPSLFVHPDEDIPEKTKTTIIVGGIIGGLLLLVIIIAIVFLVRKRRQASCESKAKAGVRHPMLSNGQNVYTPHAPHHV